MDNATAAVVELRRQQPLMRPSLLGLLAKPNSHFKF
jgi:hypothetical protein